MPSDLPAASQRTPDARDDAWSIRGQLSIHLEPSSWQPSTRFTSASIKGIRDGVFGIPAWQTPSTGAFGRCCSDIIGSHFVHLRARYEKGKAAPVTPDDFLCVSVRIAGRFDADALRPCHN